MDAAAAETFRSGLEKAMATASFAEEGQQILSYVPEHVGYQRQAENQRLNELQKEKFDAIGRGEISLESLINTPPKSQVTYQSNQYVNDKDALNDVFLPIIDPVFFIISTTFLSPTSDLYNCIF